jgi:multiple sugar transport system permease protein
MISARRIASGVAINLAVWLLILLVVFPLIWMVLTSVRPQTELFHIPPVLLPSSITFSHYIRLLTGTRFPMYFRNSMILATSTTVVVIVIATFGAYSLARFRYPGREQFSLLILMTYLLPSVVLVIPVYLLLVSVGLANTIASLVVAYTSFALPYALWLLRSFISGIPEDLEAAALIDGAGRLGAFFDVVLPQALPGIISTAIFTFILAWNEYLYALVLVNSDGAKPLTTGILTLLIGPVNVEWSLLMAASVMMSLPLIVIFTFLQGYLTSAFRAGGVKG